MSTDWKSKIEEAISQNNVMIYIRGTPDAPRCGFTSRVVRALRDANIEFASEDMDRDINPGLWDTLQEMNDWPTSPQIYVKGEFVGGCDIFVDMVRSGELAKQLH